jgi:hypothetical protein
LQAAADAVAAPTVTDVIVSSSTANQTYHPPYYFSTVDGSGDQLKTVPVGAADTVQIQFSEDVTNISSTSLTLTGLAYGNLPTLATGGFSYNSTTHIATWHYASAFPADQFLISLSDSVTDTSTNQLDGEWTNPFSVTTTNAAVSEFPSGDGTAGGKFNFVFTILPGDADRDNWASTADYLIIQQYPGGTTRTFGQGDFNGDATVNGSDQSLWNSNLGKKLKDLVFADFNHDGLVNGSDLSIWIANNGLSSGATHSQGDADNDGDVDGNDFTIEQRQAGLALNWVA